MITLILARHGETDWNKEGKLAGSSDKAVLTGEGRRQAEALARKLVNFNVDIIYCSRLKRARETVQIINKHLRKKIIYIKSLNERSWGTYEGKDKEIEFSKLDDMSLEERLNFKPEGGESWRHFEKRLLVALQGIIKRHEGQTVLILTHGGAIRALIPVLKNVPREKSLNLRIQNTSLTIFKMEKGRVEEELINDIAHLEKTDYLDFTSPKKDLVTERVIAKS